MNWKQLYKDLNDSREGMSWRKLALEVGVTPSVFTRLSQGKAISMDNIAKLLSWDNKIEIRAYLK
jgi:hypothetical protein